MQVEGDSHVAPRIQEICENRSISGDFLTILAGFILFNPHRANYNYKLFLEPE